VDSSIISGNSSGFDGGGLLNFAALTLFDTTVADNDAGQSGGGIANQSPGTLEVDRSTLSGNTAVAAGGGLYNPGGATADLLNTTVSGNVANTGGAIYAGGALALTSSSVADNVAPSASAIFDPGSSGASSRVMRSTVIVGDCVGSSLDSGGYNLESPGNTCNLDQPTDQPSQAEVGLGPLADNGGPTETHALLDGSIAIDQIPESDCIDGAGEALRNDQRGEPRPGGSGSACDVGAFEAQR
jgi:predicted outer membrane repeat protein